jgi:hypothetical protein
LAVYTASDRDLRLSNPQYLRGPCATELLRLTLETLLSLRELAPLVGAALRAARALLSTHPHAAQLGRSGRP